MTSNGLLGNHSNTKVRINIAQHVRRTDLKLLNDQLLVGRHYVISLLFNFQLFNICYEHSKQTSNLIFQMQLNNKALSGTNFKQVLKKKLTIVKRSSGSSKKDSLNFPSTGTGASTRLTT